MTHSESAAETLPNVQEPNPYRLTVSVNTGVFNDGHRWWAVEVNITWDGESWPTEFWSFPTKEEADTHAALILAALHQAVME